MMDIEICSHAQVVRRVFIHGRVVVSAETAVMGDDVPLDHGMTVAAADSEQGEPAIEHAISGKGAKGAGKHHPGQEPPYRSRAQWGCGISLTRPLLWAFPAVLFFKMAGGCSLIPRWTMILSPIMPTLPRGDAISRCRTAIG